MVAVLVAGDTAAGNAEFLRQGDAFVTLRAAVSRHGGGCPISILVDRILDVMDTVTIRAGRRTRYAANDRQAMHTFYKLICFAGVAFTAGRRNVDLCDRRFRIRRGLDIMTRVTVSANSSVRVAPAQGLGMDALAISEYRTVADAAALHDGLIAMAPTAGLGDRRAVYGGFRILGRKHGRHVAADRVTVLAASSRLSVRP